MAPSRIDTAVTRMLGIRYPIIAAPMFLVSNAALLEAAGRAGAIGAVPSLNYRTAQAYRDFLNTFPKDVPFGVNLILKWAERLEEDVAATVERKVPLVITSLGDPTPIVERVHAYGGKVWSDVISLRHAEKAVKAGVDALVAVGSGAGGHAGNLSPMVLGPWLKAELGVPVVLAGALSTGRHLAATLALGMDGAYVGTRFLATEEAGAAPDYKQALVDSGPEDLEYTKEVTGVHGNFIKSALERFRTGQGKAWKDTWSAGQGVAFVKDVLPAATVVERMVREYSEARAALPSES
ncbi:NAD(P)H-dependent flavin oxidoreductase [Corallococcus exiguus]|uniref:Nitronate monooxygenase n=1 Tax=Corallococcus exiguus TaxID=83462 RepID=A0A7X5BPS8_9BACT|nr:nitronate monooxygenase [Corallococcus exiguus]NBC38609.1 nitronate monooxygenase [Corallococcus exiguus]TNV66435.1 nitronate monooxygenase [Corallococcus exiguus]